MTLLTLINVYTENHSKAVPFVLNGPNVDLMLVGIVSILDAKEEEDRDLDRPVEIKNQTMIVKLIAAAVAVQFAVAAVHLLQIVRLLLYDHLKCPITKVPFKMQKLQQFLNK